tara:strand:+ start:2792 stop:3250 length:459 start_codon:yes stop_codon:yes gene_type:complete
MSDELLEAIKGFNFDEVKASKAWRIHYDPANNGSITQICDEKSSTSEYPYIEVKPTVGHQFIEGKKYQREYHVVNEKLEFRVNEHNIYKASDARVGQVTQADDIVSGVYFVTVRGEPDLVIDTMDINSENFEAEKQRLTEYLENNDVYKDSE